MTTESLDNHIDRFSFYANYESMISMEVADFVPRYKVVALFDLIDQIEIGKDSKKVSLQIDKAFVLFDEVIKYCSSEDSLSFLKPLKEVFLKVKNGTA